MAENLQIPTLDDPRVTKLTVCGWPDQAQTASVESNDDGDKRKALVAQTDESPALRHIRLMGGIWQDSDSDKQWHVHIDVAKPHHFKKPPKPSDNLSDIEKFVGKFWGVDAKLYVILSVNIDYSDVAADSFVASSMLEVNAGGLHVKQDAATLSISPGPLIEIEWNLIGESGQERLAIDFTYVTNGTIDSSYLDSAYEYVASKWEQWILPKKEISS